MRGPATGPGLRPPAPRSRTTQPPQRARQSFSNRRSSLKAFLNVLVPSEYVHHHAWLLLGFPLPARLFLFLFVVLELFLAGQLLPDLGIVEVRYGAGHP